MTQVSFAFVLSHELYERLRMFVRLRWIAVTGLALAAILGPRVGLAQLWPSLFLVALFVGAYNTYYHVRLRDRRLAGRSLTYLQGRALMQISLDLLALMFAVEFTGGLASPILPFFVFHMALGTTLLPNRTMYLVASAVCVALLLAPSLARIGLFEASSSLEAVTVPGGVDGLFFMAIAVTIYGTVFLTGRVTVRLKEGSIRLLEATMKLGEKTYQLEKALADIKDVERRKSHYMRLSAHQLRSPLGTVKTSLDVLVRGIVDPSSERGQRLLAGCVARTDGLLMIVNDLLGLAKIREGQQSTPWLAELRLDELIEKVRESLSTFARRRGVTLDAHLASPVILAWGSPEDLQHAFENLLQNALKYTEPPGRVRLSLTADDQAATVEIADEGIGIPAAMIEDILLEFVRAPNAKHYTSEGTGLGLSIAREAVELHGGKLEIDSREGEGTTVTVRLPRVHEPPAGVQRGEQSGAGKEADARADSGAGSGSNSGADSRAGSQADSRAESRAESRAGSA